MNKVQKNRGRLAVSATVVAIALVPLGGCSMSNTVRGFGDTFHGIGNLIGGVGQDISLAADGNDQEVSRRVNESGSSQFGIGTSASNASWTGRNR